MTRRGLCCILALVLFGSCQKGKQEDRFAKIGTTIVSKSQFDSFQKMRQLYPTELPSFFPGDRAPATFLVETEVLYRKTFWGRGRVKGTPDWKWKARYFPAQLYMQEIIGENAGFSDKEIETYYKTHLDSFKTVWKVPAKRDTTKAPASVQQAPDSMVDSTGFLPLADVRDRIKETLFTKRYPPDSAFFAEAITSGDSTIDTAMINRRWYFRWRNDFPTFFVRQEFKEQVGRVMPDSLSEWYGDGKVITPADVNVILQWLSEDRRDGFKNPSGTKYLAEWLLKWKLFAAKAEKTGFSKKKENADVLRWAWKLEVTLDHIGRKMLPDARANAKVDTAMCIYAYWDKYGTPGVLPDTASVNRSVRENRDEKAGVTLSKAISELRARTGVKFLQPDWRDEKDADPAKMLAEADSLLAADDASRAEQKYSDVYKNFPYTESGLKALTELAKVQTEKGMYREAIDNYRKFSILSDDTANRCNTFFMIGFIYDEYLNNSENAEIQYKWILKNTPECELADDAEFMCLHLGEPMTSVEELQAEARRQGRNIEDAGAGEVTDSADGSTKVK